MCRIAARNDYKLVTVENFYISVCEFVSMMNNKFNVFWDHKEWHIEQVKINDKFNICIIHGNY